ncbi:MAG: hypothetical protein NT034_03140 [Candidatus Magasanikbacteria bacterium]|nr:hypothetical protein [Candidatus Magasanikbacteria bacterium]
MFGKKPPVESLPEVNLNKIPDDFYGGNNPVVKFNTVETVVAPKVENASVLSGNEKKIFDKQTAVGAGNKLHPVNLIANSKFLLFAFLIIIALVSIVGGIYYFLQYKKTQKAAEPVAPTVTTVVPTNQTPNTPVVPPVEQPATNIAPSLNEAPLDLPSSLLGDSIDTDKDELTDPAEELFTTDASLPDTDGDKYPDNHEIYHLYNPVGKEPMKLVDSGLVSAYTNPVFNYKLYYPKTWVVGNVDSSYKDVLFSTFTGENIEVRVIPKNVSETFSDWFAKFAPTESYGDYSPIESVFKQSGFGRKDNLVYFFPTDTQVFAIIYHTNSNIVNYRIVNKLFMRSFQTGNLSDLPARIIEDNVLNPDKNSATTATSSASSTP